MCTPVTFIVGVGQRNRGAALRSLSLIGGYITRPLLILHLLLISDYSCVQSLQYSQNLIKHQMHTIFLLTEILLLWQDTWTNPVIAAPCFIFMFNFCHSAFAAFFRQTLLIHTILKHVAPSLLHICRHIWGNQTNRKTHWTSHADLLSVAAWGLGQGKIWKTGPGEGSCGRRLEY